MPNELARCREPVVSSELAAGALASLLSMVTDAVLVFGEDGVIVLANDEASRLFRAPIGGLVGTDVRDAFMPASTMEAAKGPLASSLPFPLDGSSATVVCESRARTHEVLRVQCELIHGTTTYVLVSHVADSVRRGQDEHDRLVEELSRANRRLSGTLHIVLGTLDSLDIGTLFSQILDEITQTMDAWATVAYVAERGGYRLRGKGEALADVSVPVLVPYDHPLHDVVSHEGRAIRVDVRPPSRDELRKGLVTSREVRIEEIGAVLTVPQSSLPPFSSFVMVPVWFGGHMIALLEVGWRHSHKLRRDDTRLLDAVAEYLSVQLAGAFASLRAQHAERLESLGTTLRERLLMGEDLTWEVLGEVFQRAAEAVEATCCALYGNPHQRITMGDLPTNGHESVPVDLAARARKGGLPRMTDVAEVDGLAEWLAESGEPSQGVLVELGMVGEALCAYLLLREATDEPFEDVDLAFVRRLADDVGEVRQGERARQRDKRISEALQRGMRNELQLVEGLSSQSCYSSATEAAYVGGDFYDLVRLPERRACVIMGDVSGKGVEAASVSSAVKTALGAYAWEGLRPARMVDLLNDFLLGFSRVETFATLFVGIVDLGNGTLTYCSAGHPPAMLARASTGELVTLGVQSGVVGAFSGLRYQDGETVVRSGDVLVLYTDGVTEARNPDGAFFGEDGLRDAVSQEVSDGFEGLCDRLLHDVSTFTDNSLEDDVALVVLRFDDVGEGGAGE